MEQNAFSLTLGGVTVTCHAHYSQTAACFGPFRQPPQSGVPIAAVSAEALALAREQAYSGLWLEDFALEYNELAARVSEALLPFDRCLFHGTAFLWRGRAYLFTAPSGTGKTTQYVLWKLLYGEEIRILNGDKPVLEFRDGGEIWVHPSPWAGKENMNRPESAPLGGVIYLSQGQENTVCLMPPKEAVVPLFFQFLITADTEDTVRLACRLEERLLNAVPVWHMENRGDEASARLCHNTILQYEEGRP